MSVLSADEVQIRFRGFMLVTILVAGLSASAQQINRALGRPATASSSAGASYTPDRAVDGDSATRWSSAFTNSEWWSVDLGATYNVTRVVINWEAAYATAYDLQVSSDGVSWTTFFSGTNSFPENSAGTSTAVTPGGVNASGRYVRVVGKNRAIAWGGQWGYSAWEIQVFGDPPAAPPPPPVNNTVLKRLRVVTWNIAQGYTLARQHDEDDQLDLIASFRPDVVVLNEVSLADNDMPTYYTSGLQARTSKPWNGLFTQAIAGAPPANAQGTMILTWLPVDDKSSDVYCAVPEDTRPPNDNSCTGFVRLAVTVNSVPLHVVGVHLNWYNANYRSLQLDELRRWLSNYGPNQVVGGDFNAEPNDVALWVNWLTSRRDVWAQVTAAAGEPGFTRDMSPVTGKPARVDYQFIPANPTPIGVQQFGVVHTVLSDHHALVVDYIIQ